MLPCYHARLVFRVIFRKEHSINIAPLDPFQDSNLYLLRTRPFLYTTHTVCFYKLLTCGHFILLKLPAFVYYNSAFFHSTHTVLFNILLIQSIFHTTRTARLCTTYMLHLLYYSHGPFIYYTLLVLISDVKCLFPYYSCCPSLYTTYQLTSHPFYTTCTHTACFMYYSNGPFWYFSN